MAKWICRVCGYTHYGDKAPENCPQCGASQTRFYSPEKNYWRVYCIIFILMLLAALVMAVSCGISVTVDNSTIRTLDLNQYMGKWYEIARFDHKFERNLTHCTAYYALQDDGTITITNQGIKNGKLKTTKGKGRTTSSPGILRVSFFGPFYSDYRVLMLSPDYSYALVGSDSDGYLWILSRTPHLPQDTISQILSEAIRRDYPTEKLIWVEQ